MKSIKITILSAVTGPCPVFADLLAACPGIDVIANATGRPESGAWPALAGSDVLLIDEAVLAYAGSEAVRSIRASYPRLKILLVLSKSNVIKMITALSLGISGVMLEESAVLMLCKAVRAIHEGEVWVSREVIVPLQRLLGMGEQLPHRMVVEAKALDWRAAD